MKRGGLAPPMIGTPKWCIASGPHRRADRGFSISPNLLETMSGSVARGFLIIIVVGVISQGS